MNQLIDQEFLILGVIAVRLIVVALWLKWEEMRCIKETAGLW
jgi:hypothetical protein